MNYKDLSLEERINLASQYALLLVADDKPTWEIIGILKTDYALTEEQAAQAVGIMRSNYKNEYNSTARSNLYKALGAIGVSIVAFLFYYFMAKEMGRAGIFFMLFAIMFALGGVGALLRLGRIIGERFSKPATAKRPVAAKPARKLSEFDKILQGTAFMSGFLLCFAAYEYFFQARTIDVRKIATIDNCIITEPVKHEHTGGKSRSYYYVLKLRGSNLDFRFFDSYYKYSKGAWFVSELKEGDTVSVQLLREDLNRTQHVYSTGDVDLVNLGQHGHFLVDHGSRNTKIRKDQKSTFYVLLAVFAGIMPVYFFRHIYNNKKHHRQTAR